MQKILIKNGTIYNVVAGEYYKSDILIEGSTIKQISSNVNAVSDMCVVDASGKFIFPGFIDAHSHIGVLFQFPDSNDCNECSSPSTQRMRITDALRYDDPCFLENAQMGVTTAMITPGSGNVVCGQAAVVKTYAPKPFDMISEEYKAFKLAFGENPKSVYGLIGKTPMSRMGTAGIVREFISKAILYMEEREKGGKINLDYEMFLPVLKGEIPCKIHCHRADDILTAIRIMQSFGLRYTLDHCTEGYKIIDEIKECGANVIVGPLFMFKSKPELANADPYQAIKLSEKGISVSIASDHNITDSRYLGMIAGQLVKEGLPYAEAIRMLTINPARAIEMDSRIGSIEQGKEADMFMCDGDPLEIRTKRFMTIIGGNFVPGMEVGAVC